MSKREELQRSYEAIFLAEMRGEIDRVERIMRIVAMRDNLPASGFTLQQRDDIANAAARRIAELADEVSLGPSGRWQ